jgi:hypothetical protein
MATKKTGNPRGRPRKNVIGDEASKRGKGRPDTPVCVDPKRYLYAFLKAHLSEAKSAGVSQNKVAETIIAIFYGRGIPTRENAEAFLADRRFQVYALPDGAKVPYSGSLGGEEHRDKNTLRQIASRALRSLREINAEPRGSLNRLWLKYMSDSWKACLFGCADFEGHAWRLATMANEAEYFEDAMLPVLRIRYALLFYGIARNGFDDLNLSEITREGELRPAPAKASF